MYIYNNNINNNKTNSYYVTIIFRYTEVVVRGPAEEEAGQVT